MIWNWAATPSNNLKKKQLKKTTWDEHPFIFFAMTSINTAEKMQSEKGVCVCVVIETKPSHQTHKYIPEIWMTKLLFYNPNIVSFI